MGDLTPVLGSPVPIGARAFEIVKVLAVDFRYSTVCGDDSDLQTLAAR